jgi:hypothetical protein
MKAVLMILIKIIKTAFIGWSGGAKTYINIFTIRTSF